MKRCDRKMKVKKNNENRNLRKMSYIYEYILKRIERNLTKDVKKKVISEIWRLGDRGLKREKEKKKKKDLMKSDKDMNKREKRTKRRELSNRR